MMRAFWGCVAVSTVLAAGAAQAQVRLTTDEIPGPPPYAARDDIRVGRGPYAAVPPMDAPSDVYGDEIIPPFYAARILRSSGYQPLSRPVRRGLVYTVAAINPQGLEGRAMLDAHTGRLMRFVPAAYGEGPATGYGPPGPPPRVAARGGPRPPANVPHVASRTPTATPTAPAPAASALSATAPVAKPDARPAEAAPSQPPTVPPAQQQAAASPPRPAADAAAVAAKPAPAPKPPVVLQPTQPMPPVQDFE